MSRHCPIGVDTLGALDHIFLGILLLPFPFPALHSPFLGRVRVEGPPRKWRLTLSVPHLYSPTLHLLSSFNYSFLPVSLFLSYPI